MIDPKKSEAIAGERRPDHHPGRPNGTVYEIPVPQPERGVGPSPRRTLTLDQDNPDIQDAPESIEERPADDQIRSPRCCRYCALRDIVVFPFMIVPPVRQPAQLHRGGGLCPVPEPDDPAGGPEEAPRTRTPKASDITGWAPWASSCGCSSSPTAACASSSKGSCGQDQGAWTYGGPFIAASVQALRGRGAGHHHQGRGARAQASRAPWAGQPAQQEHRRRDHGDHRQLDDPGRLAGIVPPTWT